MFNSGLPVARVLSFVRNFNGNRSGIFKSLDDAACHTEIGQSYSPTENHPQTYMKYFEIFESLSSKQGDEFEKIAALQ